jgi:hypothetical protein
MQLLLGFRVLRPAVESESDHDDDDSPPLAIAPTTAALTRAEHAC